MIWKDVFTNFDSRQVPETAELLCSFARGGRQILLLTRHDHVASVFGFMNVPNRELVATTHGWQAVSVKVREKGMTIQGCIPIGVARYVPALSQKRSEGFAIKRQIQLGLSRRLCKSAKVRQAFRFVRDLAAKLGPYRGLQFQVVKAYADFVAKE